MSYFGTSGPAQDGGFIAGIGAGANRLKTARAARAKHSKYLGSIRGVYKGQQFNDARMSKEEFYNTYSEYLTADAQTRYLVKSFTQPFWVTFDDLSIPKAYSLKEERKEILKRDIKASNPELTEVEINIFAERSARAAIKEEIYIELFVHAGYIDEQAGWLAADLVSRKLPGAGFFEATVNTVTPIIETTVVDFDPEKEGAVEYVAKDAWPQNWVQYALYGGVAYYIYYKLSRRKANRVVTARKGAFYGVFS
jgi:hypothetical protein